MIPGLARSASTVLLLGFAVCSPAAASPVCDRLSFDLATLSSRDTPRAEARKFARAIVQQKRSLRELGDTLRSTGCSTGSLMVIGGPNASECSGLAAKKTRMERNLAILEDKRLALMANDTGERQRKRLVTALASNRCNEEPLLVSTPADSGPPLVGDGNDPGDRLETIQVPSTMPDYQDRRFVDLGGAARSGSYRTMCVRTCDGAFFPISSHASTLNFGRDAQVCSMMCPGSDTELYYHSLYSESSEMRSASTGKPYRAMKTAFRYKVEAGRKPDQSRECGCNFSLYYQEMMRRQSFVRDPQSMPVRESSIVWLKPALRTSLTADKPISDQIAASQAKPRERAYLPNGNIRVIGPQFFPDQGIDFTKTTDIGETEISGK